MTDSVRKAEAHEAFWKKAGAVVLIFMLILYLSLALIRWQTKGTERSSFVLPVISLLDHGSFFIDEDDVETAGELFPEDREFYRAHYDEHLPVTKNGSRYPYYLGIGAPLCIPAFCACRLVGLNPGYAFPVTFALLVVLALWVIYRFAKISESKKVLAILLLGFSPIILYTGWWEYELPMFAFVLIAMVFWLNRWRKLSALFLSLAGTMNSAAMAFGIFMIIDYFLEMLAESGWSAREFVRRFVKSWKKTAALAVCFLPSLVPFVICYIGMGRWNVQGAGVIQGLGGRFLAYLFDLNLGLFPYFPVILFLFAAAAIWGGVHGKRSDMLCTFFGAMATVAAYSLHYHINSGGVGIARYNAYFSPIILLGTIYYIDASFSGIWVRRLCSGLAALSCLWCVFVVGATAFSPLRGSPFWWSPIAETVLEYAPGLYDPLPSTFHCRTDHIDGAYDISEPVIYTNVENYVRKVLVPPGMLDQAVQQLSVPEEDRAAFDKQCAKVKRTDKYYYLDFPAGTHIRKDMYYYLNVLASTSAKKSIPYELGTVVSFDGTEQDAHKYFLRGMSYTEGNTSSWTDGDSAELYLTLGDVPEKDLLLSLQVGGIYHGSQQMVVMSAKKVLLDESISDISVPLDIVIPAECVGEDGTVDIFFGFPDAASPLEMGESVDGRVMAFALQSFSLREADGISG